MPFTFLPLPSSPVYRRYRAFRLLTGHAVLVIFLLSAALLLGIALPLGLRLIPLTVRLAGLLLLFLASSSGALLCLAFGRTYWPYLARERSLEAVLRAGESGDANALDAFDFELIAIFSAGGQKNRPFELTAAWTSLLKTEEAKSIFQRLGLNASAVSQAITQYGLAAVACSDYLRDVLRAALSANAPLARTEHALGALLLNPLLKNYLRSFGLIESDVAFVVWWINTSRDLDRQNRRWWAASRLLAVSGVGLSWAAGFTPLVDALSRFPSGNWWDQSVTGREDCLKQLITTLARQEGGNVLLVGQPGTGRLGIVKALARLIRTNQAHPALRGGRVVYLHVGELLGLGNSNASQLGVISRVLNEMERAGNIIAVVDGLGSILGGNGEGKINLTEVLLPFLSSAGTRVVVIMSGDEYNLRLKTNEELIHYFETVFVPETGEKDTLKVLALAVPGLENRLRLYLPYKTLRALVEGTSGILQQIALPERVFDVLEEAVVVAQATRARVLTEDDVNDLLTRKVGVPVGRLRDQERHYLLNLETFMHQRLVDQDQAVSAVARAMIRARAGVRDTHRPIGSFLFLGPTGVGKTETAKTLAEAYFGSEEYLTRFDMSEFSGADAVELLIGSPARPVGRLTGAIEDKPFAVLLLDEFEKASRDVLQLLLPVIDEGLLTDVRGRHISFKHAIIIATSNAGAEFIREAVSGRALPANFDDQLRDHILHNGIFRPELLNRFDGIITFTPLSLEHVRQIAGLMLRKLNRRLDAKHGITVTATDELINYLAQEGYQPEFGARPMNRLIQDKIEYLVARRLLEGTVAPGEQITFSPSALAGN